MTRDTVAQVSSYDDRIDQTKALIDEARDAIGRLSDDQRAVGPEDLHRLEEVLDFAEQVVGRTRATLVPDGAWNQLDGQLSALRSEIDANPDAFVQSRLRPFANETATALAQFPPGRGRIPEQQASATLDRVREAAETRIDELREELKRLGAEEAALREAVGAKGNELEQLIEAKRTELQEAVTQVETQLGDEKQRIESTTTEQAEAFREAQEKRDQESRNQIEQEQERYEAFQEATDTSAQKLLDKLTEMRDQGADLVGSIGVTGTSERYREEANDQRKAADRWRLGAVLLGLLAVGVALIAAVTAGSGSEDILPFVGKLAIGAALGGLAAYAAKQSGRHRDREETAKSVQLDLAAFGAFIQPLEKPEQDKERKILGQRIFGQRFLSQRDAPAKDGSPALLDQLAQALAERRAGSPDE